MSKNLTTILHKNDEIGGIWRVIEKIGEGGCGVVFENSQNYAMKVELANLNRYDRLLKTEAMILKKLQFSDHIPQYYCFEKTIKFRFLVMNLLGETLSDIKYQAPNRRLSLGTVLRIGQQVLQAIRDVHRIYYVHRDIKPANFALGIYPNHRKIYLFDFGLARSLLDPNLGKKRRLRQKRNCVGFRGTVTYCSPNVHLGLEHGRHDDIWSMLYMCIELIVGNLPWSRMSRRKAFFFKEFVSNEILLQGCPKSFKSILDYIRSLRYENHLDYDAIDKIFVSNLHAFGIKSNDPYDWEINPNIKFLSVFESNIKVYLYYK